MQCDGTNLDVFLLEPDEKLPQVLILALLALGRSDERGNLVLELEAIAAKRKRESGETAMSHDSRHREASGEARWAHIFDMPLLPLAD
jgi:hypothetical protein